MWKPVTKKELKEIHHVPTEKKSDKVAVIKIDWWLGRVIAMSWAITELAKQRPVKVITSRPLVFWGNPYIVSVHWLDDRRLYEDVIKGNDYFELEPYTDPRFFNDGMNRLQVAASQLWLNKIPEPVLFLAEHEKKENVLEWNNPILYQPFWSTMNQNWSDKSYRSLKVEDAQYIADKLNDLWFNVYVVERNDQPKLRWCNQLTVEYLRWLVTLAARYPVLWVDSSLHHAAKAFNRRAIVIWSWTDAGRFWYESHINLRNENKYEYVPFRLGIDFNTDIQNQHCNEFSKEFLDNVIEEVRKNFVVYSWNPLTCNCK